jgi:DNA-binding transcriptional regulator YbjK
MNAGMDRPGNEPAGSAVPTSRGARRRHDLLEAAVDVVAARGLRGLTHRAVDAAAGFPEGTTSAYLRTRVALLTALADHVAARASADVDRLAASLVERVGDHDFAIAQTQALIESWLDERRLLATRLELGLEAARQPELAETFRPWRDHLLHVVEERLCQGGIGDARVRALTVVASLDGVLLATLGAPDEVRREFATEATRMLLTSLLEQGEPARI